MPRAFIARWRDQIVIAAVALAAHGLLLINDGIFWDDWLVYLHARSGDWAALQQWVDQAGVAPTYLYIWIAGAFIPPELIGFRFVALLLIVGCGWLVYAICVASELLSRTESLLIAAFAVAYPANHTYLMLVLLDYLVFYFLFLAAVLVLLRSEASTGRLRWLLRLAALVLFVLSFGLNSLLAFYFGALLFGALYLLRKQGIGISRLVTHDLPRRLDLVVAPFAYWLVIRTFSPPNGVFSGYHQVQVSWNGLSRSFTAFWSYAFVDQFRDGIEALIALPVLWLLVLLAVNRFWPRDQSTPPEGRSPLLLLGFGVLLAVLAILPYAAVVLYPTDPGPSSRDTILLAVPAGIIIVGAVKFLFSSRGRWIGLVGGTVIASLLLGFALASASAYIDWEARWVKDSSVMLNLSSTPGADRYSVYWVDDRLQLAGDPNYRFYEWAAMLGRAFGGESRIGLDREAYSEAFLVDGKPYFIDLFQLGDLDPAGCQAAVSISPGREYHSAPSLVVRYLYLSVFDRGQRDAFLRGVTTVRVTPRPSPAATDCPAA